MNYTANHRLPQWNESDRIHMSDFNQMTQNLESSLNTAVSKADAAQTIASSAKTAAAAAQSTASSAQTAAAAAKTAAAAAQTKADAAYSPDNLPYVIGSYTGTGSNQIIQLGWMPSFLIISGMQASSSISDTSAFDRYFTIVGGNGSIFGGQMQFRLQMLPNGFAVYAPGLQDTFLPNLTETDRKYYYLAFR